MKFLLLLLVVITPCLCGVEKNIEEEPLDGKSGLHPRVSSYWGTIYKECGGVIPLSPGIYSLIEYKQGEFFDPYESCVWTLAAEDGVTNVDVSVSTNNSDSSHGIVVYFANSTGLTSFTLPTFERNVQFSFNTPYAFVVFTTIDLFVPAYGFGMNIRTNGVFGPATSAAYHVRKNEGEFTYPREDPVGVPDKGVALVINRVAPGMIASHLQVRLTNVTIDEGDSIQVFALKSYHGFNDWGLLESFRKDAKFVTNAMNPILVLLESKKQNLTGAGFKVEWNRYPYSIE